MNNDCRLSTSQQKKIPKIAPMSLGFSLDEAKQLLNKDESAIPAPVQDIVAFLCAKKTGFILSRNPNVGNCRDARAQRFRLGHRGIPLEDELKTRVALATGSHGDKYIIAVHCRAVFDVDLVRCLEAANIQGDIKILSKSLLLKTFGLEFGIVNPVLLELRKGVQKLIHIFDEFVFSYPENLPGTMMTNCGVHTWGVEFDPIELFHALPNCLRANIRDSRNNKSEEEQFQNIPTKTIGIVTGNGPESGMAIWQQINDSVAYVLGDKFTGDLSLPKVYIASVPGMGLSMELVRRECMTWEALSGAVKQLCEQGVQILCLPCHTTHYFTTEIREICNTYGVVFISMAEVVIDFIRTENIQEFAMLGISYPASLGEWSAYSNLSNYSVEKLSRETLKQFLEIGYQVKKKAPREKTFQKLIGLLNNKIHSQNVIIALTEISVVLQGQKKQKSNRRIIDALQMYGEAVAKASLGHPAGHKQSG